MHRLFARIQKTSTTIAQFKDLIKDPNTRYLLSNCEIVLQDNRLDIYPLERIIYGQLTKYKTRQLRKAARLLNLRCVIRSSYAGDLYVN